MIHAHKNGLLVNSTIHILGLSRINLKKIHFFTFFEILLKYLSLGKP